MLYGRDVERGAIDRLLDDARRGHGGALVLNGDPGMGKTALLDGAAGRATAMRVLRLTGVQAEASIPFAGLHAVLRPVLGLLPALPTPQAAALSGALGLAEPQGVRPGGRRSTGQHRSPTARKRTSRLPPLSWPTSRPDDGSGIAPLPRCHRTMMSRASSSGLR